ncbi:hypothetical protein LIQ05_07615 [Blautia glucerasea]|uniref:hypothetical protein n=1 Tax=Blautia glucerasea TaxID=536633 RepID=UPI001D0027EA|nr:hypothetical protein [Blautia glucerasea]MCB5386866.1 hypothetical protein [Blautia glucerasea]MCB5421221.1 hypothetical protein [Blautia luti]
MDESQKRFMVMGTEVLEKKAQLLRLRTSVLQVERERIAGEQTISVAEARRKSRERVKLDYKDLNC